MMNLDNKKEFGTSAQKGTHLSHGDKISKLEALYNKISKGFMKCI